MPYKKILSEHEKKMQKSVDILHDELRSVRTGRASTALVENIRVEYYGNPTPLKQMASLAAPQADMIVIKPFDPSSLKDIEKGIKASDLSIAPIVDGKVVRLSIPPLSGERREQLAGQVKQLGEQAKISIRNIRRDANKELDEAQKNNELTEDDRDEGKKRVDEMTKEYTAKVDSAVKHKTEEITSE